MIIYRAETYNPYQAGYEGSEYEIEEDLEVLGYFFNKESAQNEIEKDIQDHPLLKLKGRIIEIEVKE